MHLKHVHDHTEQRIINSILTEMCERNKGNPFLKVAVRDGEDTSEYLWPDDPRLADEIGTTDEFWLVVRSFFGGEYRIGTVFLILGNGEDVISGMSWSGHLPGAEQLMEALCDVESEV